MDNLDFEPYHQHEYINDLWEYEVNLMNHQELLEWAERGFKDYLGNLPEDLLKARHRALMDLVELSTVLEE
jgi:hypothetical protein